MPDISDDDDEELTVDMELDDGRTVTCDVITTFEADGREYIALQPLDENGTNDDGSVWLYRFIENEDPDSDPDIVYIESEEEYKKAGEAFNRFLDSTDHDEIVDT
jgi:uncharacterized protein YrzB (UPF0473 family)